MRGTARRGGMRFWTWSACNRRFGRVTSAVCWASSSPRSPTRSQGPMKWRSVPAARPPSRPTAALSRLPAILPEMSEGKGAPTGCIAGLAAQKSIGTNRLDVMGARNVEKNEAPKRKKPAAAEAGRAKGQVPIDTISQCRKRGRHPCSWSIRSSIPFSCPRCRRGSREPNGLSSRWLSVAAGA